MANQIDFILRNGLQVTNNVVVGSYTMVNTAPINGMIVSGNVGIGTADPVQKLQVVGNIQLTNAAGAISGIWFPDGTYQATSASSYSTPPGGPTNSVQYNTGSGFGGNSLFTFHNGNSHVGIGTSEAKYILDVQSTDGPARFATLNGSDFQIYVGNNNPTGNTAVFGFSNENQYAYITTGNNQPTPILVATQGNSVGIGIINPANKLDVNGAVALGTYAGTAAPNNGLIVSGAVGIGITNPSSKLAIVAGAGTVGIIVQANSIPGDFLQLQDSNSAIKFQINSSGNVTTGGWTGNAIMANYGGTGQTSYATGDILYATTSSTTLGKLGIGSTGNVLVVSGGLPTWGNVSLSSNGISGTLPISKGGTNVTSFSGSAVVVTSANGLVMSSVTSTTNAAVVFDNNGVPTVVSGGPYTYLTPDAGNGDLGFSKVDLVNGVTNTLRIANGGTGIPSIAQYSLLYGSGNTVSYGTLASSATSALVTTSTNAPQWASGTVANRVLRTDGTSITFSQVALTTDVTGILPYANGGTNANTSWTQGSIIFAGSTSFSQNNAQLFWDNGSNRLGIGTQTPTTALDVNGVATIRNGGNIVAGGLYVQAGVGNFVSDVIANSLTANNSVSGASLYSAGPISAVGTITGADITSNGLVSTQTLYASGTFNAGGAVSVASLTSNSYVSGTSLYSSGPVNAAGTATFANLISNGYINGNSIYSAGPISAVGAVTADSITANTSVYTPYLNVTTSANVNGLTSNTSVIIEGTLDAVNTTTGELIVAGGAGIGKSLYVGNALHVAGNTTISGNLFVHGNVYTTSYNEIMSNAPVIELGTGNTEIPYDGPEDRGVEFHYVSLTGGNSFGFFGMQKSTENFLFVTNAYYSGGGDSDIFYGAPGTAVFGNIIIDDAGPNNIAEPMPSISTSTGALVIGKTGGIGVGGNINVGGNIYVQQGLNTGGTATVSYLISNSGISSSVISASSAITAGSLTSNSYVSGTSLYSSGPISAVGDASFANLTSNGFINGSSIYSSGPLSAVGAITAASLTSNSYVSGTSLYSSGPINTAGNASFANITSNGYITAASISTTGSFSAPGQITGGSIVSNSSITANTITSNSTISTVALNASGAVTLTSANTTTSATSGALQVTGGIATQDNLYVAGATWTNNLAVFGSRTTTSSNTGALVVNGGVGIGNNLYVASSTWIGNLSVTNSTVASSTSTGAVVVAGGVGIGGALYVGGLLSGAAINGTSLYSSGPINTAGNASFANLTSNGFINGSSIYSGGPISAVDTITGAVLVANTSISSGGTISAPGQITGGSLVSNSTITGNAITSNSSVSTISFVASGNAVFGSGNNSTSATTGAVQLAGGIGITGNAYVAGSAWNGNLSITNSTASTDSTTGALIVAGGAGIAGDMFVGGIITARSIDATAIGNITPSTGQFTTAIVQTGFTAGTISSNGYISGTSLYSSGPISAVGTITGANLVSNGYVQGASLYSSGPINTTGNASFANVTSNGYVQGTSLYSSGPINTAGDASFATVTSNGAIVGTTVQGSTSMLTGTFIANTSVTTATLQASGTATVQTLVSNTSISGNTYVLNGNVATTSTTGTVVLDSFATASYRTAHYIVQVTDNTNAYYHATQIMLIHDGSTVYQSEYNIIYSDGVLGTFNSVVSAGTVQLQFTASAATNKTIKVLRTAVIT